jgi:hypothetical protein
MSATCVRQFARQTMQRKLGETPYHPLLFGAIPALEISKSVMEGLSEYNQKEGCLSAPDKTRASHIF